MFYLSKRAGLFEAPPEMVKQVWEWVLPRYAALVYQTTKDIKLKEAAGQDCNFNPEEYKDFETSIPLSLEGWKYDDEEFQQALEDWKDMWSDVKVFIYAQPEPEFVGQYTDANNTIDIVLDTQWLDPSPQHYERLKASIFRNIQHEVIHLGQYIFKHFKNVGFGGMPSGRISDPEYTQEGQHERTWGEKEHSLRDIEFYAILNDARIELQRQLEQWPEDMHDNIFKLYVGVTPSHQEMKSAPRQFFENLRKYEPEKWQKAVKELYKTIRAEAHIAISKRAKEKKKYQLAFQPTENQLEFFAKRHDIPFHPLRNRPDVEEMTILEEADYKKAVDEAYQFALKELLKELDLLDCKVLRISMNYVVADDDIGTAYLDMEAEEYAADKLKNHPIVRGVRDLQPEDLDINEVYV